MKKYFIFSLAVMCAGAVFGQTEKQKVAIYTTDNSGQNIAEFVGEFLTNAIVKRKTYNAVERTNEFLKEIAKEQGYQRSGNVDDNQISRYGKQMGVDLVCVVKIRKTSGQTFMSARLIEVESATLKATARPTRFNATD